MTTEFDGTAAGDGGEDNGMHLVDEFLRDYGNHIRSSVPAGPYTAGELVDRYEEMLAPEPVPMSPEKAGAKYDVPKRYFPVGVGAGKSFEAALWTWESVEMQRALVVFPVDGPSDVWLLPVLDATQSRERASRSAESSRLWSAARTSFYAQMGANRPVLLRALTECCDATSAAASTVAELRARHKDLAATEYLLVLGDAAPSPLPPRYRYAPQRARGRGRYAWCGPEWDVRESVREPPAGIPPAGPALVLWVVEPGAPPGEPGTASLVPVPPEFRPVREHLDSFEKHWYSTLSRSWAAEINSSWER